MLKSMLLAGAGGFIGTCLRYYVGVIVKRFYDCDLPVATFVVNILGCLIIGFVIGLGERMGWQTNWSPLLVTGFCGGFTTFSAFADDLWTLGFKGDWMTACLYVASSVILGLACVCIGRCLLS